MHVYTTTILALITLAAAQQVGFASDASVVAGPNAIDSTNINNGWQAGGSFFTSGGSGSGSTFNNIANSHFSDINSNSVNEHNIANNPSSNSVAGNSGWTANGDGNALGAVQNQFAGIASPFFRRDGAYHASAAPSGEYKAPGHF
ncbi:hypothetical protein EC988_004420, partial [Linderina pennispora]